MWRRSAACRHDINVPFIVAGPGIKPNTVVTHLAANYDLAPTWLQLAGISYNPADAGGIGAPSGAQQLGIAGGPPFDGKSLVPLLHGEHDRVQPTSFAAGCALTPVALCQGFRIAAPSGTAPVQQRTFAAIFS